MIDLICKDTNKLEFLKWQERYEEELSEIYEIEGCKYDGIDYETWLEDFYDNNRYAESK